MKKTFIIKAISNVTDEVLGMKAVVFDLPEKEYTKPLFIKTLLDERHRLAEEVLRTEIHEAEEEAKETSI